MQWMIQTLDLELGIGLGVSSSSMYICQSKMLFGMGTHVLELGIGWGQCLPGRLCPSSSIMYVRQKYFPLNGYPCIGIRYWIGS